MHFHTILLPLESGAGGISVHARQFDVLLSLHPSLSESYRLPCCLLTVSCSLISASLGFICDVTEAHVAVTGPGCTQDSVVAAMK